MLTLSWVLIIVKEKKHKKEENMNLKEFLIKNSMDIQQFSIESGVPAH